MYQSLLEPEAGDGNKATRGGGRGFSETVEEAIVPALAHHSKELFFFLKI